MIRKFGATGIDSQPQGLDVGISGSNIKSIQRGTATMNSTTVNVAISAVDLTKAVVIVNFASLNANITDSEVSIKATLTSSTNLQLSNIVATYGIIVVSWTVIEFNNVKSLQSGSYTSTSTSDSITISSVNMAKSQLFYSSTSNNGNPSQYILLNCYLSNATTITISHYAATRVISWYLVEFN